MFKAEDKTKLFYKKLVYCQKCMKITTFLYSQTFLRILGQTRCHCLKNQDSLLRLRKTFLVYFPETKKVNDFHNWIKNHFIGQVLSNSRLSTKLKEEITKLSVERLLKIILDDRSLHGFWHITWRRFKEMDDIAIEKFLHPFILW